MIRLLVLVHFYPDVLGEIEWLSDKQSAIPEGWHHIQSTSFIAQFVFAGFEGEVRASMFKRALKWKYRIGAIGTSKLTSDGCSIHQFLSGQTTPTNTLQITTSQTGRTRTTAIG